MGKKSSSAMTLCLRSYRIFGMNPVHPYREKQIPKDGLVSFLIHKNMYRLLIKKYVQFAKNSIEEHNF